MKKFTIYFLTLVLLFSAFSSVMIFNADFNSEDVTKQLRSYSYYMISLDNDEVIFSKNYDKQLAPAAFAKLVAAVVAIEEWGDLKESVTVTDESLSLVKYDFGVRTAGIKTGETFTKRQLVDCLIVYGANDVESVIAQSICGTKEAFVEKMNALIKKIGCKNTNITDMLGFDADGQYTTAEDVAKIIKYALNYPVFSSAFNLKQCTLPETEQSEEKTFTASNRMTTSSIADYYHASVTGGKQTTTQNAGECIAVTSSMDGYSYLTVVMKGSLVDIDNDGVDENTCMTDAKAMLQWVYNNIRFRVVASPGQIVYSLPISCGKDTDSLLLTPENEVSVLVPSKVTSHSVLIEPIADTLPSKVMAPVSKGKVICKANIIYANKVLASVNLVAYQDVGLSLPGLIMTGISSVLKSKIFIAAEIIALIVLVYFAVVRIYSEKVGKKPRLHILPSKHKSEEASDSKNKVSKASESKAQSEKKKSRKTNTEENGTIEN
ncbi:MAG: D-alanyl-D-alanine carboxypeptidase family protein [Acutalibacteraceae bacterium]